MFGNEADSREIEIPQFRRFVQVAFALDPDKLFFGGNFPESPFPVQRQERSQHPGGILFVRDIPGIDVNRLDLDVGRKLVQVSV